MHTVGGRYALDGQLGEGGMGHVYRARHIQLGKAFALKIISPAFAGDNAARARFNQEAKLASEISHPNIVSVVDFGEDAQFGAYMVMDLVEGESLVAPGTLPLSVKRAIDVLAQVADALDHVHKRGIIHGDIKAENILMTAEQAGTNGARRRRIVRLLDFGLARRRDTTDDEGGVSGSPHYLAPERAAGGPASIASDIYALGVLGYLLLSGTLPFGGSIVEVLMAQIHNAPDSLSTRRLEATDEALESLIMRALAKDPSERHASASAFRYELNTVMDMLDMGRRQSRRSGTLIVDDSPREMKLAQAFERSRLPMALVSLDGMITSSNPAFHKLVNLDQQGADGVALADTALATFVPGLSRALRRVHTDGTPSERRARVDRGEGIPPLELVIWLSPLPIPGSEIHMMIRVDEVDR
jgi:eukaryotic-like serine/threonine-protein kinase